MSYHVKKNTVPADVLPYTLYSEKEEGFVLPPVEQLLGYKVLVTTCAMAGQLYNSSFPPNSFDTVIVDEAGHLQEPSIYQAVSFLLQPRCGLLVLAGDPMQLGPVTLSNTALGVSMLERLLKGEETVGSNEEEEENENEQEQEQERNGAAGTGTGTGMVRTIYSRNMDAFPSSRGFNPSCITKLIYSYRCHEQILRVPNELFYDGELQDLSGSVSDSTNSSNSDSDGHTRSNFALWPKLPSPGVPLIFHCVKGVHKREAGSPSWFNIDEIAIISQYLGNVMSDFPRASIGIIAPYRQQVGKIKQMLHQKRISRDQITVGSCEQFQGGERDVIIISTVRSVEGLPEIEDVKFNLGFVASPKRFNVAVTRAKQLLIIIGNPDVLTSDTCWRALIAHCKAANACVGYEGFVPVSDAAREEFFSEQKEEEDGVGVGGGGDNGSAGAGAVLNGVFDDNEALMRELAAADAATNAVSSAFSDLIPGIDNLTL